MRSETGTWLEPMLAEAERRPELTPAKMNQLMSAATMAAAETNSRAVEQAERYSEHVRGIDWVRYGQMLRHELGWDDTYPAFPDYPEIRDQP